MEKDKASTEAAACFEESLAEVEKVVHDLEEGRLGLGEALARYEQGVKHLKQCYQLLEDAERKIELLVGVEEDGTPITEPFDIDSGALEQSAGRRRARKPRPESSPARPWQDSGGGDVD